MTVLVRDTQGVPDCRVLNTVIVPIERVEDRAHAQAMDHPGETPAWRRPSRYTSICRSSFT
jgi:hypothetical protein